MDSAIALIIILLLGILIVPLILATSTNSKVNRILDELLRIKKQLQSLQENNRQNIDSQLLVQHETPNAKEFKENLSTPFQGEIIQTYTIPDIELDVEADHEEVEITISPLIPQEEDHVLELISENITPKLQEKVIPQWKSNLEQFIAEKLISIIGIIILVLGIVFTVKWAIDRNMIHDAGKISIGLLSGTLLIGIGHKLSKKFRAFSSILAGGGIAVLYFSIYQAYQGYQLIPQAAAFICMIIITIVAVILSLFYDKKEMAIIAILGGFGTPFLVSNGSGNYQVLFTYILILNIGMLILSYFKKWKIIHVLSYGITLMIFSIWMINEYSITQHHQQNALAFATAFYLIFLSMNLIYPLKNHKKFAAFEIGLLLSNTFLYFGTGLYILKNVASGQYQGIFTIVLAIIHFILLKITFKSARHDRNLSFLLIALVLTFISLTAPIQLEGNYITLFWACEMVILYYLSIKSNIELLKNASLVIMILTLGSLIIDWNQNYNAVQINQFSPFLNKAFMTGLIVIAALFLKRKIIKQDKATMFMWGQIKISNYTKALELIFVIALYLTGFFEINYQCEHTYRINEITHMVRWIYQFIFIIPLYIYIQQKKSLSLLKGTNILIGILLLMYPIINISIIQVRTLYFTEQINKALFNVHYLIPILGFILAVLVIRNLYKTFQYKETYYRYGIWISSAVILCILSCESIHIWVVANYEKGFAIQDLVQKAIKITWPILWGLASFFLMFIGMRKKIKLFRIISLSLFALTILKLFTYDINNVSQGGKIAAFIILGIILLLVAFMYQKFKGLFIDQSKSEIE